MTSLEGFNWILSNQVPDSFFGFDTIYVSFDSFRNEIPRIDHDDNHKTSFRVLDSFLNCKDVLGGLPSQIEERNEAS